MVREMKVREIIREEAISQNIFKKKTRSLKDRLDDINTNYVFITEKDRVLRSARRNQDDK